MKVDMMMDKFVKITVLEHEIQAQLLEATLREKEIPHRLHSYHDSAYDGLWQMGRGWGSLMAPEAHKEEILAILKDLADAQPVDDEELG